MGGSMCDDILYAEKRPLCVRYCPMQNRISRCGEESWKNCIGPNERRFLETLPSNRLLSVLSMNVL